LRSPSPTMYRQDYVYDSLACISANFKKLLIEDLERLYTKDHVSYAMRLKHRLDLREVLILQTCNRFEIYAYPVDKHTLNIIVGELKKKLRRFNDVIEVYEGLDAVRHIFRVASGLDSMIIGEPQILGQVESTYQRFLKHLLIGDSLKTLLEWALKVGRKVRRETCISRGTVDIVSASIELLKELTPTLHERKFLIIGAGAIGRKVAAILHSLEVKNVAILNRTVEKAKDVALKFNYEWGGLNDILKYIKRFDIIISAITIDKPIITCEMINSILPEIRNRNIIMIDLSTPRSIDPDISRIDGIILKNIDDVRVIARRNYQRRLAEVSKAERIIEDELKKFTIVCARKSIDPLIAEIYKYAEDVRKRELKRARDLLSLEDVEVKTLDLMTKSIVKKILHPIVTGIRKSIIHDDIRVYKVILRIVEEV